MPARLQRGDEFRRAACGGGDEFNAGIADEFQHRVVAQETDRQVDAERQLQRLHLVDFGLTGLGLARGGLDDAEAAGARHRRSQLGAGDPAHRGLHNRIFCAGMGENAVHGCPLLRGERRRGNGPMTLGQVRAADNPGAVAAALCSHRSQLSSRGEAGSDDSATTQNSPE